MKRVFSILLCVLILWGLAVPVAAEGSAQMRLTSSSATLYPGDSFAVTVTLTNDQPVGRGGIVLSYNTAVFELVGGSCNVSGAALAEVSAGRNGGVFALAENRVVSGTIFTIQMRVKSDAPIGTYTISGTASMDVACAVSGTSVTVACKHTYGAYAEAGSNHIRVCSACGYEEVSGHSWNSGTVIQSATCKDSGTVSYTCTDCGAVATETVAPNGNHRYSGWVYSDESGHLGTCTVCGKTTLSAHDWTFKEVTQEATCIATGTQTLVCSTCGGETTEEIPLADHNYGTLEPVDGQLHRHVCPDCGHEEVLEHVFSGQYAHDEQGHGLICDGCGFTQELQEHIPGPEATADASQDCTVCGRMLKAALNHLHTYAEVWSADENGHWYTCQYCENRSGQQFHSYESACDDTCDICGYIRVPPHDYSDVLRSDATGHYYPCRGCGGQKDFGPHTPGPAASISTAQTCTACGYELAPRLAHDHEYTAEDGKHYHTCLCGETTTAVDEAECGICGADPQKQLERFPWWILCIIEGILLAAAAVLLLRQNVRKQVKTDGVA